jgi:hypothetical protein
MTYRNNASQRERAAALRNDTLHSRQQAMSDLENVGRHAKPIKADWNTPDRYPRLPESSWSNQSAMVPPEESFGVDINAVEAMGEPHEQASLGDVATDSSSLDVAAQSAEASPSPLAAVDAPTPDLPAGDVERPQPATNPKRRRPL